MSGLIRLIVGGMGVLVLGLLAVATLFFFLLFTLPLMLLRALFGVPNKKVRGPHFFRRPGEPPHGPAEPPAASDDIIDVRAEVISTRDDPARTPSDV